MLNDKVGINQPCIADLGERERHEYISNNFPVNGLGGKRGIMCGVGINDAHYRTKPKIGGFVVSCPAYESWKSMIRRCYSANSQSRNKTYIGVTVCNDWHRFTQFLHWWLDNQVDGWHLDKDILSFGREYSPENCLFVPQWLNKFTLHRSEKIGGLPVGASFETKAGMFRSQCWDPVAGKQKFLGYFKSSDDAHSAWMERKIEHAISLKPKMDDIDIRIYPRVVEIINCAK